MLTPDEVQRLTLKLRNKATTHDIARGILGREEPTIAKIIRDGKIGNLFKCFDCGHWRVNSESVDGSRQCVHCAVDGGDLKPIGELGVADGSFGVDSL